MSTYDYIVQLREKQTRGSKTDIESGELYSPPSPPRIEPLKVSFTLQISDYVFGVKAKERTIRTCKIETTFLETSVRFFRKMVP